VVTVRSVTRGSVLVVLALLATLAAPPGAATAAAPPGAPWRIVPSPNLGAIDNHLQEVSCVTNVRCVAVGFNQEGNNTLRRSSVAQTLSGGAWRVVPVPKRGTGPNSLWNVSCVSTTRCVAVGYYLNIPTGFFRTLIATFNGSAWTLVPSPSRAGVDNYLFGVACADATHCVAVGRSHDTNPLPGQTRNLVLTLNGSAWTLTPVPERPGMNNLLTDVSCADALNCKAAGFSANAGFDTTQTLVISRSGPSWTIDVSADRASSNNLLRDISCPTATRCVAVGASDPIPTTPGSLVERSLIQSYSAGTWTIETSRNRPGFDNHLWAVSCKNPTNCVVAGQSQDDQVARPLIQTLAAGTWTLASPSPYRANTFNYLYGLSCTTYRNCVAVGDYRNSSGVFRTTVMTNTP
jgi:hypothetical protein